MADAQASGACYGNIVWVARLRILWWVHRVGSSPIFRIKERAEMLSFPLLYTSRHAQTVII